MHQDVLVFFFPGCLKDLLGYIALTLLFHVYNVSFECFHVSKYVQTKRCVGDQK